MMSKVMPAGSGHLTKEIKYINIDDTEDTDKWKKYVHGVANPRIEDG